MDVQGKIALITGGARVGRTVAEELARRGCWIALTYRTSRTAADETLAEVEALGARGIAICGDLRREDDIRMIMATVEEQFGGVDILINLASVYRRTPLETLQESDWRDNLEVDLGAAYRMALAAAPPMRRRGTGRIVNFADWLPASGRPRYPDYLPYYVAKSGVIGLTQALALELAPEILVNAVAPGPILPPPDMTPEEVEKVSRATPLKRWGGPLEIARTVLFLVETEFVTGECIRVDGGRHLS